MVVGAMEYRSAVVKQVGVAQIIAKWQFHSVENSLHRQCIAA